MISKNTERKLWCQWWERSEGRVEEGACGCLMYNKWPRADALAFSPILPLLPVSYSLYVLWTIPCVFPPRPCTLVKFPVFSIIIPFFLIPLSVFHWLLFPLSCFVHLCPRRILTAKMSKQHTGFTVSTPPLSSTVMCTIKFMSICVSLHIQYVMSFDTHYPAVCMAAIHCVCAHWGLQTSSVVWRRSPVSPSHEMGYNIWDEAVPDTDMSFSHLQTKENSI